MAAAQNRGRDSVLAVTRTSALAELVDLFPTAVELSGLPAVPAAEGLEGKSLVPVLTNPAGPHQDRTAAFSQYPRCPSKDMYTQGEAWECLRTPKSQIETMGYSVRVTDWRYTEWRVWQKSLRADWTSDGLVAAELYNHAGDTGLGPDSF